MLVKKYCVYVHRRKDNNQPFYIGCCSRVDGTRNTGVKKYRRAFDFKLRRPRWFEVMDDAGGLNVEIAYTTDSRENAYQKEFELVEFYGREYFDNGLLTNECLGGWGAPGQNNSRETRERKSIQQRGHKNSMYGKRGKETGTARRVMNVKTSKVFESVSEAAEQCGYKMKTLYNWLSGHRKNPTDLRFI
jgi:hypothetical protein